MMRSPASDEHTGTAGLEHFGIRELRTPATLDSIDKVQDLLSELMCETTLDFAPMHRIKFETALVEVLGNVVAHSTPGPGRVVFMHIQIERRDHELSACITDDGAVADINLDLLEMPAEDDEHGRGLAMAHALATELHYDRDGGTNRWFLRCDLG